MTLITLILSTYSFSEVLGERGSKEYFTMKSSTLPVLRATFKPLTREEIESPAAIKVTEWLKSVD